MEYLGWAMYKNIINTRLALAVGLALLSNLSFAAEISGLHFMYKDWELACDNTGACRAAGYQADEYLDRPISLLFQRAAGGNTPVVGRVKIVKEQIPISSKQLEILMLGQSYGTVSIDEKTGEGKLSNGQTEALLKAVQSTQPIVWKADGLEWRLSTAGASAVLLKFDDFQKRIGTTSALIRKGTQSNDKVLKTQPLPLTQMKHYQRGMAKRLNVNDVQAKRLALILKKSTNKEDCWALYDQNFLSEDQITIYPLNRQNMVVEAPCWRGAYNYGYGYWVMDKSLKQIQQFVTTSASSFSEGQIFATQKGRGIGDCSTQDEWAWNGNRFVKTYQVIQAQCKGFVGGAWDMPVLISKVQEVQ